MEHWGLDSLDFREAARDYQRLLDKGYPQKGLLKLIGDRYRLTAVQRTALYRGVVSTKTAWSRKRKRTKRVGNRALSMDGYNVLYTVANYLQGRPLFISNDGYLRDAGELHGRHPDRGRLDKSISTVLAFLRRLAPRKVMIYLDSPVAHSGEIAAELRNAILAYGLVGSASTARSADAALRAASTGVISSSDSAVIDRAMVPVFDLARHVLFRSYGLKPIRLDRVLR